MKLINIMAASLDGRIALASQESDSLRKNLGFTSPADREHLLAHIRKADAVILGANSLRAGADLWKVEGANGTPPLWVIYTMKGITSHPILGYAATSKWIVSPSPLPHETPLMTGQFLHYGHHNPATWVYDRLVAAGIKTALLFGGSKINLLYYKQNLVDELALTVCPLVLGSVGAVPLVDPDLPHPIFFKLLASKRSENHVFLNYKVIKSN